MYALAIDTSSAAVTAAVAQLSDGDIEVLAQRVTIDARAHAEVLTPSIEACLGEAGLTVRDLAAVVADVGPGPFTGLRVGLVTAAVLGDTLGIPTYGVPSLDAIAVHLTADPLLVAGDARRHEVYWARYVDESRRAGPDVGRPEALDTSGLAVMAGAGARRYADVLGLPLLDRDYPAAIGLVTLAAERIRKGADSEVLTPLYLRRPDAVEPPARKAALQG
ncbi:MAG: tRNA (adenosine(37)-N6)-threonylcarbamoyltransferase complex dimerization subunit type 1 TsaB [Mycobacteriales bacterium]